MEPFNGVIKGNTKADENEINIELIQNIKLELKE